VLEIGQTDDPDPVKVSGSSIWYTVYYTNTGNADAEVLIVDTCDRRLQFGDDGPDPDTCTDNQCQWSIGTLPARDNGALPITVTVPDTICAGTVVTNTVTITADPVGSCPTPFDEDIETTLIKTGAMCLSLTPQISTATIHTLPGTAVYPLTLRNHSALSDTVVLSVESDSLQVVPTVIPSSPFLTPYGSESIAVQVPLPADFTGDRVTTTVHAEARNQLGDASAVQVTYYQPYNAYLPLIWKKPPPLWQCKEQGKNIWALAAREGQSPHIYAGPDQPQLLESTGCDWRWPGVGPRLDNIVALAVCDSKLYMAVWGSHVWVCETAQDLTCHQERIDGGLKYVASLACDENAHLVYAGTNEGAIFGSAVGSGEWQRCAEGLEPVWALHVDSDEHVIYAGTLGRGVYRGIDCFSSSWAPYNNGLLSGDARRVWALEIDPDGQLCGGTNDGVFCVEDDCVVGYRWMPDGLQGKSVYALATDLDKARLYAGTNGDGVFARIAGDTWIPLNNDLSHPQVNALLVQQNCEVILAGTKQGVCTHPLDW
jgi:hypothetical protein